MSTPRLDDFELLKVLGKGSYGKVTLVRHKPEGSVYAMKMLRKDNIIKRNQVDHTKTERSVLEAVSHPFIVNLHFAFQTPKKLYLVLEYCAGEIILAIEYLHSLTVIYRDLKPENLLLDGEGHSKVTDFGLSKEGIMDNISAKTMCGTPEYLAPEILDKKGHGRAVDWYSVGALVYEMLTGLPPYYTRDRDKLFERIRKGDLSYPSYMSAPAKAFVQAMLFKEPNKRLGGGPTDGEDVKGHAFWSGSDWTAILQRRIQPPFKPNVASDGDVKYFDKEFLDMPVVNSEVGGEREVKHFEGFTYTAK